MDADPRTIRSIAVSAEDVVDAFVYTRENPGTAVLRVTPPFHGRMRARLHVYRVDDSHATGAVHLHPADLLEPEAVESFPSPESFADRLEDADSPAAVRGERGEAVERWRDRARGAVVDAVALDVGGGDPVESGRTSSETPEVEAGAARSPDAESTASTPRDRGTADGGGHHEIDVKPLR